MESSEGPQSGSSAVVEPAHLDESLAVPEAADVASIVAKLREYDGKGDVRRNRHDRDKYVKSLMGTVSPQLLQEVVSHSMSVGPDGKIGQSSSINSLRDRLIKNHGAELAAQGMGQEAVVAEQVRMYKDILTAAASQLPDAQRDYYLKKRLNPNVNAKAATLRGEGRASKRAAQAATQAGVEPVPLSRRMQEEAIAANVATAQAALDRARNPFPSDQTPAYFTAIGEHAAATQSPQIAEDAFARGRENNAAEAQAQIDLAEAQRKLAEIARNQARTDAATAAEDWRKDNPNYVNPADPENTAAQERVREHRLQENQQAYEEKQQADAAAAQARAEAQLVDSRARLDAKKVETSKGYTDSDSSPDFSSTPLPSDNTDAYFSEIGKRAADAAAVNADMAATMDRVRKMHQEGIAPEVTTALQQDFDAAQAGYMASFPGSEHRSVSELVNSTDGKAMRERFMAMDAEMARLAESKTVSESSARDRVLGLARRLKPNRMTMFAAGFVVGSLATAATYEATQPSQVSSSEGTTPYTDVLPSSQMPSEQNLAASGIRIGTDNATDVQSSLGNEQSMGANSTGGGTSISNGETGINGSMDVGGTTDTVESSYTKAHNADNMSSSIGDVTGSQEGGIATNAAGTGADETSLDVSSETKSVGTEIASETISIPEGSSWGAVLSGVDGSTEEGKIQIEAFLNDSANLDLIEATVLENPQNMTYAEVKALFDAIRSGERPQSDGWHLLDDVAGNTPVQRPTEAGVQTMHDNRDAIYANLINARTNSELGSAETAVGGTPVDQLNAAPAASSRGGGLGARIRGFFGGRNGQ